MMSRLRLGGRRMCVIEGTGFLRVSEGRASWGRADHGGRSAQLFHARHANCALAMVRAGGLDLFRLGLSSPAKLFFWVVILGCFFLWGFWMET